MTWTTCLGISPHKVSREVDSPAAFDRWDKIGHSHFESKLTDAVIKPLMIHQ